MGLRKSTNILLLRISESEIVIRGSFGKVKLCYDMNLKIYRAMKILNKERMKKKLVGKDKTVYNNLLNEIAILKKMVIPSLESSQCRQAI